MTSDPPDFLDGAKVLSFGELPKGYDGTGSKWNESDGKHDEGILIRYLAIAKYEGGDEKGCYLFACSVNWEVLGDLKYDSEELAKAAAPRYYEISSIDWISKK